MRIREKRQYKKKMKTSIFISTKSLWHQIKIFVYMMFYKHLTKIKTTFYNLPRFSLKFSNHDTSWTVESVARSISAWCTAQYECTECTFFNPFSTDVSPVHVVLVSLLVDQLSGLFLTFFGRPKKNLFSLRKLTSQSLNFFWSGSDFLVY